MEVKNLSTTLINNWPLCPSRAWHGYARRLEFGDDTEGSDQTRFGTIVHAVQERIHQSMAIGDVTDPELGDEYIMGIFNEEWQQANCTNFEIFAFGNQAIADFVRRGIKRRLGETIATELLFVLTLETGEVALPPNREMANKWAAAIQENGLTPVISEIDRVDKVVEGDGYHIKVYDYKTNFLPFTRDEIENSKQLGIYRIVAGVLWPEALSYECVYDMLRHGQFPVTFDQVFLSNLCQYLINLFRQIKNEDSPETRLNKYCNWCEIRSNCSTYAGALSSVLPQVLTATTDTDEGILGLYDEYEHLANLTKLAEERKSEIREALRAKIEKDNFGEALQVGDSEFYLVQNARYEIDKHKLFKLLKDNGALILLPDMMTVSKTSMERVLKSRPELKAHAEELLKKTFVTPTLKRRHVEGGKLKGEEPDGWDQLPR